MKINMKKSKQNSTRTLKPKNLQWNRRLMKHGSYSLALSAIVIAAIVLLNLVVNELPSQYTKIDLSSSQLSVLTEQTTELLSSLTEDITIYYLAQDSNEDETVSRLLERYEDLSGRVTVIRKDPVLYPKFASQYTEETLSENSVIITRGDASRVISYEDMYQSDFDYTYYSYQTTGFDGEGQITSAISALCSGNLPKLYILSGHGEVALNGSLLSSIEKENIENEALNLVSANSVPEDADALLIAAPTRDLSDGEAQKILNYLKRGGQVLLFTDYTGTDMPNLTSVLEYYGVSLVDGVVMENDSNHFIQMPYYLLPTINNTDVSSDLTGGNAYVLLAAAQGLRETDDTRDSLQLTDVLSTSSSAYSKTDVENMTTYEQEDDDIDGPFTLGLLITEDVELTDELLAKTSSIDEDSSLEELKLSGSVGNGGESSDGAVESGSDAAEGDTGNSGSEVAENDTANSGSDIAENDAEIPGSDETKNNAENSGSDETENNAENSGSDETANNAENSGFDETENDMESSISDETVNDTEDSDQEYETATTKLAVFTSSALLDSSVDQMVSGGNSRLVMNTLSWICGNTSSVSVPVKSMSMDYLTVPSASGSFWSIVMIGLIPGIFLAYGLYIWLRRRKQ